MNYASWGRRVAARLIDGVIIAPFFVAADIVFLATEPTASATSSGGPLYYILVLLAIALWGYNRGYRTAKTGQSWGKKALGIKLINPSTNQPIGIGTTLLRGVAHLADILTCGIGYLLPLWDNKKQTIADKVAKTVVIAA